MRLQATIVLDNVSISELEDLLENSGFDDYFTEFNYFTSGSDAVIEVYSENIEAGYDTADFLEDNGYYLIEYIIE